MKRFLLSLLLVCACIANAQNSIDLVNMYWRTAPYQFGPAGDETRYFNTWVANFTLPVVINPQNAFVAGFEYQQNDFNIGTYVWSDEEIGVFTSYTLQLGLEHKWNDRSKLLLMSFTRLNTDYDNMDISHFQLGGLALGTTSRSETFDWKYGLYYNAEFFGPMFVPLFGFNWQINDKLRMKLIIPLQFELRYQPTDWYQMGLRFDGVNGSYRTDINSPVGIQELYVDKADNNLWLFHEFNIAGNVWFHVKGGHSILRKYRYYGVDQKMGLKLGPINVLDSRPISSSIIDNGFSFETRLIYRFPID